MRDSTKRRLILASWILGLLAAGNLTAIGQTSHIVDVTNNIFTPKEITITQGDTVIWTNSEGRHNVNGQQSVYPSNPETFGNAVGTGWEYSHVFTIPGVYDYQCDPHVQFGMVGKVTVMELLPDILLAEDSELGMILTDREGFTLYYFTKDALPDTSLCTGGCVDNWPLFYVENPELGDGLDMADFGVIEHPEGGMQSTYKGWPLYYWVNDLNPGETKGEAVGDVWFVAKPDYSIMLMDGLLIGKDGVTYNSIYEPGEEMVQYFVDEYGRTLFIFVNDSHNNNNFTDDDFGNNGVWPVYEEELQHVASTLDKSMFGSIDVFGHQQLTFKGWPLYYFGQDAHRGQTTGVSVPSPGIWPVAVNGLEDAPVLSSVDESASGLQIRLYPNPATDEIQVSSDQSIESVSLINILGANIRTIGKLREYNAVISLDGIEPGIYFLEVQTSDKQKLVRRFVKR